jgi:hypothetical protein
VEVRAAELRLALALLAAALALLVLALSGSLAAPARCGLCVSSACSAATSFAHFRQSVRPGPATTEALGASGEAELATLTVPVARHRPLVFPRVRLAVLSLELVVLMVVVVRAQLSLLLLPLLPGLPLSLRFLELLVSTLRAPLTLLLQLPLLPPLPLVHGLRRRPSLPILLTSLVLLLRLVLLIVLRLVPLEMVLGTLALELLLP